VERDLFLLPICIFIRISIHSLRVERDVMYSGEVLEVKEISIHSLRVERDSGADLYTEVAN